jgi:Rps23 Pro-64 3,4-dihydroxylase Tpa1-like proline 4-hydroxylase
MESARGGWLGVHSDYLQHGSLGLWRRLNLLIYLNPVWEAAWGGSFELWDRATLTRGAAYLPLFNRLVLFPTTADTLHGHPVRNACPEGVHRRLLSVYYWSVEPPHAPAGAGRLRKALARARRVAYRAMRRLRWRGPKFYAVDPG